MNYTPYKHFLPFHNRTQRFAFVEAHRRAGKTWAGLGDLLLGAKEGGRYLYVAPNWEMTLSNVSGFAWGFGFLMNRLLNVVQLPGGGSIEFSSSESFDFKKKPDPFDGVVLDEPWLMKGIERLMKLSRDRVTLIGTPVANFEMSRIAEEAKSSPEWFCERLPLHD